MATHFTRPRTTGGAASKPRPPRINLGPMRQRFMKSLGAIGEDDRAHNPSEDTAAFGVQLEPAEELPPRFPMVRRGYDPLAVDEHITELERELTALDRELADVRGRALAADEVNAELKRIGEQTSAVLIAAHEQADEILRGGRQEAERLVSDAAARATALTAQAEVRLRELELQNEATHGARERLFKEVRDVSAALAALVDSAPEQAPSQA